MTTIRFTCNFQQSCDLPSDLPLWNNTETYELTLKFNELMTLYWRIEPVGDCIWAFSHNYDILLGQLNKSYMPNYVGIDYRAAIVATIRVILIFLHSCGLLSDFVFVFMISKTASEHLRCNIQVNQENLNPHRLLLSNISRCWLIGSRKRYYVTSSIMKDLGQFVSSWS